MPIPLVDAVKKSPGIYHVKVLKTEIPFEDEGTDTIRLAYCKVISTLKESSDQPIVPAQLEGPFHLIVSLLRPAGFSPIGEGDECIIFWNTGGLTPTLVGGSRMYQVEGKMIKVYASDFPDPKLTKAEIETLCKDPAYKAKRIKIPLKTFLDRVTKLQAQTSIEQNN